MMKNGCEMQTSCSYGLDTFYNIASYIIIIVTNQKKVGSGQHICNTTYRSQCPQHSYDVYVFTNPVTGC